MFPITKQHDAFSVKSLLFLNLFLFTMMPSQAQLKKMDELIAIIPASYEKSIESVISYIEQNAQSDLEKARGAFCWIATHVRYDIRKFEREKSSNFEPDKVFKKRKAVCVGYANLFQHMCLKMHIQCELVSGYSKGYGYKKGEAFNESDHVWNAVYIDSAWRLVDVTWASGVIKKLLFYSIFTPRYEPTYFYTKAEELILDHLPEVPMWQLLEHPVSLKAFSLVGSKIYNEIKTQKSPYFNYNDSIYHYLNTEPIQRGIDFGKMALRFNPHNPMPLAVGMLMNVENNIHQQRYSISSGITLIDSMIFFTENALRLFKMAKNSSKALNESQEENTKIGNQILAELHFLRAGYYEHKLSHQNLMAYDSVIYISNQISNSLLTVIKLSRETHKRKLLKNAEEQYCYVSLRLYGILGDFENKETDPAKKKRIHKQAKALIQKARNHISEPSDCRESLMKMQL